MDGFARASGCLLFALSVLALGCGSGADEGAEVPSSAGGAAGGATGAGGADMGGGGVKATGGSTGTGGTSATGGSTGTGGAAGAGGTQIIDAGPVVVHPCSSLPTSNQWENITPTDPATSCTTDQDCADAGIDCTHCVHGRCDYGDSMNILVHPTVSGTLYAGLHRCNNGNHRPTDGLYKSTDCGATWGSLVSVGRNADKVNFGSWWFFVIDPTDPNVMYAITGYGWGGVWKSTNGGVDWDQTIPEEQAQYIPGLFLNGLGMDPTDSKHLVATVHVLCTGPSAGGCLPETFDGGATWKLLKGPDSGWAEGSGPIIINRTTLLYARGGGLDLTTDDGATWTKVNDSASPFSYRSPGGTYYVTTYNGLITSKDGRSWSPLAGSRPRLVGITGSDTDLYTADQWSLSYYTAPADGVTALSPFTKPGQTFSDVGAPWLTYDLGHHVLYSSSFWRGVWRIATR